MQKRFELHHLSGKTNSTITLTVHNFPCHAEINGRQAAWDSRWARSDNSDMLKGIVHREWRLRAPSGRQALPDRHPAIIESWLMRCLASSGITGKGVSMDIVVRCFVDNANKRAERKELYYDKNLVFVFDCEATPYLSCPSRSGAIPLRERPPARDRPLLRQYKPKAAPCIENVCSIRHHINLISRDEFSEAFFHYVYDRRAVCVGQNLDFDLSRIATSFPTSKLEKVDNTAFSLQISNDSRCRPRIYIRHLNNHLSFRRFIQPYAKNKKNKSRYPGVWIDTKTLVFALTSKSLRLDKACELFKTEYQKQKTERFDIIDADFIRYNLADVKATFSLYQALLKRIKEYDIPAEPYEIVSPASMGPSHTIGQ